MSRHKSNPMIPSPRPSKPVSIAKGPDFFRPEVLASIKPGGQFLNGSRLPGARTEILDPSRYVN